MQFSIRSVLILVTVLCVSLAVYFLPEFRRQRQQAKLEAFQAKWAELGGQINSNASCDEEVTEPLEKGNPIFSELLDRLVHMEDRMTDANK